MEIGLIFLYSLFTIIQIFILLSTGMISFIRKIYTADSLKKLSMILLNLFFPVQGMLEIARMATPANVQIFWIMIITVSFSMFLGYLIGLFLNWTFGLEYRIRYSYALILAIPSLGTLPLVLGKAFCYPGGPLEGDPQCSNMLGYMNINSLIFNLILFISGFKLIITDKNFADEIELKMSYIWPIICENLYNGKNFAVLRLFEKYMKKIDKKEKNKAEIEFEKFDKEYRLFNITGNISYEIKDAKGEIKVNEKYNSIIDREIEKDENKSKSSKNEQIISSTPQTPCAVKKDEDFNISKQIEIEEIEKENRRRKESINKSILSASINKNCLEKSYEQRIQKIQIDENDLQISVREIEIEDDDINEENNNYKKDHLERVNTKNPNEINVIVENQFFQPILNTDAHLMEDERKYKISKKKTFEKKASIRISKFNYENLIDNVKNYIGVQSISDFKNYVGNFIKVNHRKLENKLNRYKETHMKQKEILKTFNKVKKYEADLMIHDEHKNLKKDRSYELKKQLLTNDYKNFLNHKLKIIRKNTINIERNPIIIYYEKLFEKIEEFRFNPKEIGFDLHEDNIYHIEKMTILMHLHGKELKDDPELKEKKDHEIYEMKEIEEKKLLEIYFDHEHPPSFPIARGLNLNEDKIEQIKQIWEGYNHTLKQNFKDFELVIKKEPADFTLVLNKIYSPILLGSILGLVIGLSGMRDILFSSNHYIQNFQEGILVISKAAVPFLYISVGVQFLTMQKIDLNMTLSKKHIIISLIHRYIIMPGIGLIWVYIWANYYGGMVKDSKVFRIAIFIPFCVPSSANISMIVNLIGYFKEETSVILLVHNLSMLVGLTILYLIYFIVIGT